MGYLASTDGNNGKFDMGDDTGPAMLSRTNTFESIVGDLYEGTFDEGAWDRGLRALAGLVGGEGPLLISVNPSTQELRRFKVYSYDAVVYQQYFSRWLSQDIRIEASKTIPLLEPFTEARSIGDRRWRGSLIFNEFLYQNDCAWTLNTTLHRQDDKATALVIQATRARGPFSPEDCDHVRPLIPHVRRALEIKDRLELAQIRHDTIAHCLDRVSLAILLLDDAGRIVEASSGATEILCTETGIRRNTDGTVWLRGTAGRELNDWITHGTARPQNGDGLLHVPRPLALPLSVMVARLPTKNSLWIGGAPPCWMLLLLDPDRRLLASTELIAQDLAVSLREAELAALLVNGYDIKNAADRLHISYHTARTHLKSIFSRTGIHSQAELVRRIACGPAGVRPCR